MADSGFAESFLPTVIKQVQSNQEQRGAMLDSISKMLNDQVPSPMQAAGIAQQTLTPITSYEVARGIRRPSYLEATNAARAASLKYNVDLMDMQNKGLNGAAGDVQVLTNALNAQTLSGNQRAGKVKDVLSGMTQSMSPESAMLFTKEYLSRLGSLNHDPDSTEMWNLAGQTANALKLDPKTWKLPEFNHYQDESGNNVYEKLNHSTGEYEAYSVAPPRQSMAQPPVNQLVPNTVKVTDPKTGITTETTTWMDVAKGRGTPSVPLGIVGAPNDAGGNGAVGPGGNAMNTTKTTPPPPMDFTESSNLQSVKQAIETSDTVRSALIGADGKINTPLLYSMELNIPRTDGKVYRKQLEESIYNYIFIKSGKAVTEQERQAWVNLFMPSVLDNTAGVKDKLYRLDKFFKGATVFLPQYMQERLKWQGEGPAPNLDISKGASPEQQMYIDKAIEYSKKGKARPALEQWLKSKGVDPSTVQWPQ